MIEETRNRFACVPEAALKDKRLTLWQYRVLATLYMFRNKKTGMCCPTLKQIGEVLDMHPVNVCKALSGLRELKWIESEKRKGRNHYTLAESTNLAESAKLAPDAKAVLAQPAKAVLAEGANAIEQTTEQTTEQINLLFGPPKPEPNATTACEGLPAPKPPIVDKTLPDDRKVANWMFDKIVEEFPSTKRSCVPKWANTVRIMREQDKRTHDEIAGLFQWANKDPFWKGNIRSPEKLRKQWDTLSYQRRRGQQQRRSMDEGVMYAGRAV